jgi:hypothetical protein
MADTETPTEGTCGDCRQTRPLFPFGDPSECVHLLPALIAGCDHCVRGEPLMLCARCWSTAELAEEANPLIQREAATLSMAAHSPEYTGGNRD